MNSLWRELLKEETLGRGWHMARLDTRTDFAEDLYSTDVYALDLRANIREAIARLTTGTWQARPLMRMEVPKGSLSFRPGAVIPIHDRVIVCAITLLMAPVVDKKLPDNVYSWRVKKPLPRKGPIFYETDITDLPFLKKSTIRKRIDPFEPWYGLWPEFDQESRSVFLKQGYRFLATSDISAYFENIQLPILRDQLLGHFPEDPRLVNLLCSFLESWTVLTGDGRLHMRGIPQGNLVSSFLGNLFLLPLDQVLLKLTKERDVLYYRYVDDVRLFTKDKDDARLAIFSMDRTLRELHLNVQSAKTKIYDEHTSEVSNLLIDTRVDQLGQIIEDIQKSGNPKKIPFAIKKKFLSELNILARSDTEVSQKIIGARRPLEGLTMRAFSRWTTAHSLLESDAFVGRLLNEIEKNADFKLTKKLVNATRRFPRRRGIQFTVLRFLKTEKNIFPFQEAECIRALRYLSTIDSDVIQFCWDRLRNTKTDRYVRMQSAYLLARCTINESQIKRLERLFESEQDPYVQVSISTILVQKREKSESTIQRLVFHPNIKVRDIGKLFRVVKNDETTAKAHLNYVFESEIPWVACDNMPFIHLMAASRKKEIREALLDAIRFPRIKHPIIDVRSTLKEIFVRTRESLES